MPHGDVHQSDQRRDLSRRRARGGHAPTAVKFFNAAANTGLGSFTVTPTVGVFVPSSTFAGSYSSTLTVSIVSGP